MRSRLRALVVLALSPLAACGSGGGSADPDAAPPDATPTPEPDAPPAARCEGRSAQPLDDVWTLSVAGADRSIRVHVPASYDPTVPTPVVLAFHGYTLNSQTMFEQSHLVEKSDAEGFILAAPDGTGALFGWNAGDCCGTAAASGVDDVGFVGALIDELALRTCVDEDRVYATGFSNGGFLSHRLACELADRIAAVAPVSGVMGIDDCNPSRPVPVFEVHGTGDLVVPYAGGGITAFRSVAQTISDWADRDACPSGPPTETYAQGDARCETHASCGEGAEVTLCTITDGGHQWPGGTGLPGGGTTSTDLVATDAIWAFFVAHPRVR
jgi:polyhydroxybutyrate depolymerase